MLCPIDKTSLNSKYIDDLLVELCPKCWGIWLEEQTFRRVIQKMKWGQLDSEYKKLGTAYVSGSPLPLSETKEEKVVCPNDYASMDKYPYAGDSKVIIDRCEKCGGFWLDGYEILMLWNYVRPHEAKDGFAKEFVRELQEVNDIKNKLEGFPADQILFISSYIPPFSYLAFIVKVVLKAFQYAGLKVNWGESDGTPLKF